ncbi:MAG: hypothetical protein MZV70_45710 [Desulfobacterales bacterium]|nr:hypothetical protein [Desulfobacterales bacterium]
MDHERPFGARPGASDSFLCLPFASGAQQKKTAAVLPFALYGPAAPRSHENAAFRAC